MQFEEGRGRSQLRRLRLRARQRGLKETCLLLDGFASQRLSLETHELMDSFDALLAWSDQEILSWILMIEQPPEHLGGIVDAIRTFHTEFRDRGRSPATPEGS
ncbi:MAG: succinate dehydrogenase assembly factor 2 [Rhodobacteraceae bacterium]|nr:succinate dehydrogenase assembly factor 2 [Paracoccaceae bacterium]